ncbi:MAG: IPT/TIG domain-containing protein [Verrucomicrobiota bacterium]
MHIDQLQRRLCPWGRIALAFLLSGLFGLNSLTAQAAPLITAFNPTAGPPGTSVQITGNDLGTALEVDFGNAPAVFSILSANLIVATVPLDATSDRITVDTGVGAAISAGTFFVAPTILDFQPDRAPPGSTITLLGLNFEGATAVRFNGTNAQFSVTSPTQIRAVVPPGATSGHVSVTTPIDEAQSDFPFTVTGREPFVGSFSPTSGAPGTVVTIEGANFTAPLAVRFNGTNATQPSITSPTQIRVAVPAGASSGLITVSNSFGAGTSVAPFVVSSAPVIEDFSPIGGAPGTSVTINGRNFLGTTAVKFGGKPSLNVSVVAPTQLHAVVPTGATNGPISITTPQGTGSSAFDFIASASPIVTDFNPTNGPPNTLISINGFNFIGTRSVKLNGTNIAFAVTAPTQLSATIPPGASSGFITVSNAAGSGTSFEPFLVTSGKPIVTNLDPPAGQPRTSVTIEGLDFNGVTAVNFNGTPAEAFQVLAPTQIKALVPAKATTGPVGLTKAGTTVLSSNVFIVAPGIATVTPAAGIAGTPVTLRGTNFGHLTALLFKDVAAAFDVASTNEITTVVPAEAASGPISLIGPAGIVGAPGGFVVQPNITGFTPASGASGTAVTIAGTGFGGLTKVQFGDRDATSFQSLSRTQLVVSVPAGAATGPITVVTASGTSRSAQPFIIGAAADLALLHSQLTNVVFQSQVQTYTLTVTNRGPASSSGFGLTNTLPPDVLVLGITNTQGVVRRVGQDITLTAGTLAPGSAIQLKVTTLPLLTGTITNVAFVTGREPDPDPSNNGSAQVSSVVTNLANLRIELVGPTTFRVSWPVAAGDLVLESTAALAPPTRWQPLSLNPITNGDRRSVTVPIVTENRFFRLRR